MLKTGTPPVGGLAGSRGEAETSRSVGSAKVDVKIGLSLLCSSIPCSFCISPYTLLAKEESLAARPVALRKFKAGRQ